MRIFLLIQLVILLNLFSCKINAELEELNNTTTTTTSTSTSPSTPTTTTHAISDVNSSSSRSKTGTKNIKKLFEDTILITFHLKKDSIYDLFDHFTPLNNKSFHFETINSNHELEHIQSDVSPNLSNLDVLNKLFMLDSRKSFKRRQIQPLTGVSQTVESSPLKVSSRVQLSAQSSENARIINDHSLVGISVSQQLNEQFNGAMAKQDVDLTNFQAPSSLCPFKTNTFCDASSRFQSLDGSCNNLRATWLGKAETPYKRYMSTAYDDGIDTPRSRSVLGGPLPNPREISRSLFNENSQFDATFTHITAIFGQFLAHDVTSASVSTGSDGRIVDCPCNNGNPQCMSINMPSNENLMRMSCMRMTRSSAAFSTFDCRLGHREQLNLLTSFLDLTQVYGPNDARMRELRAFQGGQLKSSFVNGRVHLPQAQDGSCRNTDAVIKCFAAGEGRTNENSGLTSLQTLFLREHNRIASELSRVNTNWDDNRLFQETRKILIGIYQNIIYSEFLPALIGWNTAAMFDLVPLSTTSYYGGYNANINPQLSNEFATAAFRMGHTLIRNSFGRFDRNNQRTSQPLILQDIIFRPVEIYNAAEDGMESILRGMINEPVSKYDTNFADTLQNHLFESRLSDGSVIAIDLAATNINRGRDHGLPPYNVARQKCGFRKAQSFQDLADLIPADKVQVLSSIYQHVDDIDLYVGGLAERPVTGAVVGSTFACIIANQFKELKKGDRFYYENGPSPTSFTLEQLREIKKSTLAKMICDNVEINQIQPNAFMTSTVGNNQRISCNWLRSVDLTKWKSA